MQRLVGIRWSHFTIGMGLVFLLGMKELAINERLGDATHAPKDRSSQVTHRAVDPSRRVVRALGVSAAGFHRRQTTAAGGRAAAPQSLAALPQPRGK